MKKIFVAVALVATIACMASCNKDEYKCWKTTTKTGGIEVVAYTWATQNEMEAIKEEKNKVTDEISFTYVVASKYKTAADCVAANLDL